MNLADVAQWRNAAKKKEAPEAEQEKEEPEERKWKELTPTITRKRKSVKKEKQEPPDKIYVDLHLPRITSTISLAALHDTVRDTTEAPSVGGESIQYPPGYNKRKRDMVKLVLVVVAAGLLRGDPKVATVLSIVAMVCLKEGTFWSTRNIKWMILCVISFGLSLASWSLERGSDEVNEEKVYAFDSFDSVLWMSAKTIQLCWGMTLSVFLVSAYTHGHNSLLEFDFLTEAELPPSGPRKDPPPKTYVMY